jgi:hypothetical protein
MIYSKILNYILCLPFILSNELDFVQIQHCEGIQYITKNKIYFKIVRSNYELYSFIVDKLHRSCYGTNKPIGV